MPTQFYYTVENMGLHVFAIMALEAQAIYTWQFREIPGAKTAALAQVCKGIWILAILMFSISTDLSNKIFWITVQKLTAALLPYIGLVFTWQISRQENLIPSKVKYFLFVSICCILLIMIANWQNLLWQHVWLDGEAVVLAYGTGQWLFMRYGFLLGVFATVLAVRWILTSAGLRRRQALWYFLAVLTSWASFVVWKLSDHQNNEAVAWGFLLNGAVVIWIYYHLQLNIMPLAQAVAIRNVVEGLLFIDDENYIVDINPTARVMLNGLPVSIGDDFKATAAAWPALAEVDGQSGSQIIEAKREQPDGHHIYQLSKIPLPTPGKHSFGRIILLKDITEQRRNQAEMIARQRTLAILEERTSLARELHDNLCQLLGFINIQAQAIAKFVADGQSQDTVPRLRQLATVAQGAYDDVREYLQDVQVTKMIEKGLAEALKEYVGRVQLYHGISIDLDIPKDFDCKALDGPMALELLRIVQEAINNVRRHAQASRIHVALTINPGVIIVSIADNGKGFDYAACSGKSFGLAGMRERAEKFGGRLEVFSVPEHGAKVVVEIPLTENRAF